MMYFSMMLVNVAVISKEKLKKVVLNQERTQKQNLLKVFVPMHVY